MNNQQIDLNKPPQGYSEWLADLKIKISTSQQKASLAVNRELVLLYWQIGNEILTRQAQLGWGAKVIERLAKDLHKAFPEMKGFSRSNLLYMRQFADVWRDQQIVQQLAGQLPWGHNLVLLAKLENQEQRIWYIKKAIEDIERKLAGVENE